MTASLLPQPDGSLVLVTSTGLPFARLPCAPVAPSESAAVAEDEPPAHSPLNDERLSLITLGD